MGTGTGIGRVRGLGSAKSGAHHWWIQRATSAGNVVLLPWLLISLLRLPSFEYKMVVEWLSSPLAAVPMVLLILNVFHHMRLGLQVLIEDYVHDDALKVGSLLALNLYTLAGGAFALFSVLKIALGGAA